MKRITVRVPCETCRGGDRCELRAEFLPRFFVGFFDQIRPSCSGYDPVWYRGIEGCLE